MFATTVTGSGKAEWERKMAFVFGRMGNGIIFGKWDGNGWARPGSGVGMDGSRNPKMGEL